MNEKTLLSDYGTVKVTFSSFYKFSFTFTGQTPEGHKLVISVGGCPDEVYRFEVVADHQKTVASLMSEVMVQVATVYDADGTVVASYDNI
jgi:hypothetical protein